MSIYPRMFRIRQTFERPRVDDVAAEVDSQLARLNLGEQIKPGHSVAISAGSRGIANIDTITKAAVDHLKRLGAEPFVVPAMGSHGGGTAEGQKAILAGYGITDASMGCPIRATMETVVICETTEGIPVHFDRYAYEADHVLVCGRVKPHTDFVGDIESGLMKMMLIGLGKHEGAKVYHRAIQDYSFAQIVHSVADRVLSQCGVVAGLAIVENAYEDTARIEAVPPNQFEDREKELLVLAKKWMARLPFEKADILLVDEIGKNISGAGMDTNIIGRKYHSHQAAEDEYPKVKYIAIRGISKESHGNAAGIGMAEYCTTRALEQADMNVTRINCLTAGRPQGAMIPVSFDTDREILDVALPTIGLTKPEDAKILWIRNTLDVEEVECSQAYLEEAQQRDDIEILTDPRPLQFDAEGNLLPLAAAVAAG